MPNVLLADDDRNILEALSHLIEQISPETHVFCAENGQKALELLCSQPMDFVFTDIKMPLCDGLEMMKKMRQMNYHLPVVIISGFNDFEYAREAISYGAAEYLLKPVSETEFIRIFFHCVELTAHRRHVQEFYSPERVRSSTEQLFADQHLLSQLFAGTLEPALLAERGMTPSDDVTLFLVHLLGDIRHGEAERQLYFLETQNLLSNLVKDHCHFVQGEQQGLWVIALIGRKAKISVLLPTLLNLARDKFKEFGLSASILPLKDIKCCFDEALHSLSRYFYNQELPLPEQNEAFPYPQLLAQITDTLCSKDEQQLLKQLSELFSRLAQDKPPVQELKHLLIGLPYSMMAKNSVFIGIIGQCKFTENDLSFAVQDAMSSSHLHHSVQDILLYYLHERTKKELPNNDYAIQKAKDYIEKEYVSDISLAQLSKKLGLHPNYFSSLFKAKTGQTYSQYLRSIRIEKAKELLRQPGKKPADVAEQVGYNDSAHFYRAFKETCGMTPAEYRKTQR